MDDIEVSLRGARVGLLSSPRAQNSTDNLYRAPAWCNATITRGSEGSVVLGQCMEPTLCTHALTTDSRGKWTVRVFDGYSISGPMDVQVASAKRRTDG